jgi:hypothetical protein
MKRADAIRVIAMLSLAGMCACSSDRVADMDKHQYVALEKGNVEWFNVVQVSLAMSGAAPDEVATDLVPAGDVNSNQTKLSVLVRKSPPWLKLEPGDQNLLDFVDDACKDEPPDRIHWILSVNPVIVGIGTETDENPRATLGAEFFAGMVQLQGVDRLVTHADLHRTIDAICFSDAWAATDNPAVRIIALPARPTILEVLRQRPWMADAVLSP